jgi:hypothetical protein
MPEEGVAPVDDTPDVIGDVAGLNEQADDDQATEADLDLIPGGESGRPGGGGPQR